MKHLKDQDLHLRDQGLHLKDQDPQMMVTGRVKSAGMDLLGLATFMFRGKHLYRMFHPSLLTYILTLHFGFLFGPQPQQLG